MANLGITSKTPIVYHTPDGDIELLQWASIVDKLDYLLTPIIIAEKSINDSLTSINNKLDTWIDEGGE
jgi:hypothetical protein